MSVKTEQSSPSLTLHVTAPIRHICPFRDEVDDGSITITWRTLNGTFELHDLREYLKSFAEVKISHESLTDTIYRELSSAPSIRIIDVETTWRTAGMEVQCSTSATPAGRQ
jgi:NADPH-dependent 7-cyano-7-deazaguanine reductase QueF